MMRASVRAGVLLALLLVSAFVLPGTVGGQAPQAGDPSAEPSPVPSHDWRAPGFVAVVDGRLFDPDCWPLVSVGSNVPNLMFRRGLGENLEWMRRHGMRWFRVIVTGHARTPPYADAVAGRVEGRLTRLLREVEAFNAAHDPRESIYVLASLTDYYEPGLTGDRHGYDKPGWCLARVLNAPWFRRGVRSYDFRQECGGETLAGAPNYEVNYKPWVQRVVAAGADSPALLGWQLGNEMKARNSANNAIAEAYDWYLDWTIDMVETIRAIDRAHLIFAGGQHMAELIDWHYRADGGPGIQPDLRPHWQEHWDRMLRACGEHCWNVWSLSYYDFQLYPVDDAMLLQRSGVATMVIEHGLALGPREDELRDFGGSRPLAVRDGLDRPWQDLTWTWQPRLWGVAELAERTGLQGVAPWSSPAPGPGADPLPDADTQRGITNVPDETEMWRAWSEVAARLEAGNRRAGPSDACASHRSS
jgi:hypothetical protein